MYQQTDRQMDGQTDGQTDKLTPIYSQNLFFSWGGGKGGYNNKSQILGKKPTAPSLQVMYTRNVQQRFVIRGYKGSHELTVEIKFY